MRVVALLLCTLFFTAALVRGADPILIKAGDGNAPSIGGNVIHLLTGNEKEVNSVTFPAVGDRPMAFYELRANVVFDPGGEGFGILIMNSDVVGADAAVQTVDQWEEPNRHDAIGIGFDSRDPASDDAFNADGNLYDRPQREISVHVDGREILNRQSADFAMGKPVPVLVRLEYVAGGALITVRVGETNVYDAVLLPGVRPFVPRVAIGARAGGKVKLDLLDLAVKPATSAALQWKPPRHVVLFDHTIVSLATTREPTALINFSDVPAQVARVIATVKLEAPPEGMDKWDRRAALYLYTPDRQRFEIVRFKTPFNREWEWQTDVTDFLPLFKAQQKLGLFVDTWREGFKMTVTLDFYEGKPERTPIAVVNLWQGEPIMGDPKMPIEAFFDEKNVTVPAGATSAKLRIMATGHGQFPNSKNAGEFLGLNRTVGVNGQSFSNLLWKTDNYLNPCRPQKGTWKYDRAGWAPGSITQPWTIDLTPIIAKSRDLTLDYVITDEYVNEHIGKGDPPTHWIESQVIFYK